ncbi:MAG: PAS domain S-box protein [Desulfobacteraceae bacterium]|nr:PAS domain S-box protein [Desulfobacteraceae bacterium]
MNPILRTALVAVCLLMMPVGALHGESRDYTRERHILLLNSYHKGFTWTDEITRGVEETLLPMGVNLHIEYMDTKRQFDTAYQSLLSDLLHLKHRNHRYDVIIASDNNAFNFLKEQGKTIFGTTPVVICGVNYLQRSELMGLSGFTGVNEQADLQANLALIRHLHPERHRVVVVTDNTTTGKRVQEETEKLRSMAAREGIRIELVYDVTIAGLIKTLQGLDSNTAVLYTLFLRDRDGKFLEFDRAARLVSETSPVPVYGVWNFNLGHGILGGHLIGGFDQGSAAAGQALAILSGTQTTDIPVVWESPTRLRFDHRQLRRFNIPLSALPEESEILFRPESFYRQHKFLVWNVTLVFAMMTLALLGMTYGLVRSQRAKAAIRESELKFRTIFESAPHAITISDAAGRYIDINPMACKENGLPLKQLIGKRPWELPAIFRQESSQEKKLVQKLQAQGSLINEEIELFRPLDNTRKTMLLSANTLRISGETCVIAIATDITDRKLAEEELKKARNYISNIIDSMPSALIGVDKDGKVTQWNMAAKAITGIKTTDARGKPLTEVFPWMVQDMKRIEESITTREIKKDKKRPRPSEQGLCYDDVTIYPLIANGVEGAVIRIDDITDHVRMEEMMIQSEKMLSVGGLAAGMAHEINNPLAGMLQTASVMENRLTRDTMPANLAAAEKAATSMEAIRAFMEAREIPRMITAIKESGSRVAGIVNNMLSFARKGDTHRSPQDMAELMDKTLELASTDYDLKKKYDFRQIEIVKNYRENLPKVLCEGSKIQQVFLNILTNGAQAMQEQREIQPRFTLGLTHDREKGRICIQIEDNGPGMAEKVRDRVFEPFFTTKPEGEGTGLGLSVSYFIISENHGGTMKVESAPGKGTKFIICLPLEPPKET